MCLNVDASLCRGLRVEYNIVCACSLACRQQETCVMCIRLTSKEIVSLSIRLFVMKVMCRNRTEVSLIMLTKIRSRRKVQDFLSLLAVNDALSYTFPGDLTGLA